MDDLDQLLREVQGPSYGEAKTDNNALDTLEALEALGDLRPAEQEELTRLRAAQSQNNQAIGQTDALYRGALQGATFQQADEIYGLFGGDKEAARSKNAEAELAFPDEYRKGRTGGAIASGVGSAALTGPFAAGKTILGTVGRGAILGAAEGALWGTGGAEGYEDKAKEGAKYALMGAGIGAAAPAAAAALFGGGRAVADMVGGAMNLGNQGRALRAIYDTMRRAGKTVPQVLDDLARAAAQGQPEFRVMDALGVAGQRRASGVVRAGDDGAEEIAQFLRQRQMDQGDRILGFVDDAFGTSGTTAARTKTTLRDARTLAADEAYSAAREGAGPVDIRGAIAVIDDRIGGMQGSGITGDGIDAKLSQFRNRLTARNPAKSQVGSTEIGGNSGAYTSVELSDFERVFVVKQNVQDAIGEAVRAGRNNEARELGKLLRELDAALEASSPAYRAANDQFREASRVIESVDEGADMARRGRAADNVSRLNSMTEEQRGAAAIGYGDTVSDAIERNKAQAPNAAREFNSSKRMAEIEALARDPRLMQDRVARENTMYETFQRALGGSRTADNLQDVADLGIMADAARAGRDVATGNIGGAIQNLGQIAGRRLSGQNEGTREIMARILMSRNPTKDLARAMRNDKISIAQKRALEGIMRALAGREYAPF